MMTNRFMISVAAIALIAGAGAANAQGNRNEPRVRRSGNAAERAVGHRGATRRRDRGVVQQNPGARVRHEVDAVRPEGARRGQGPARGGERSGSEVEGHEL